MVLIALQQHRSSLSTKIRVLEPEIEEEEVIFVIVSSKNWRYDFHSSANTEPTGLCSQPQPPLYSG